MSGIGSTPSPVIGISARNPASLSTFLMRSTIGTVVIPCHAKTTLASYSNASPSLGAETTLNVLHISFTVSVGTCVGVAVAVCVGSCVGVKVGVQLGGRVAFAALTRV